jgi:hypothetical protein
VASPSMALPTETCDTFVASSFVDRLGAAGVYVLDRAYNALITCYRGGHMYPLARKIAGHLERGKAAMWTACMHNTNTTRP